jgi:hypothetical protein
MATAKQARAKANPAHRRGRLWRRVVLIAAVVLVAIALLFGSRIGRYANAAAAVGAREGCSCRYVGGRELSDCRKDFEPGMGAVMLSEDEEAKTVTARVPLLSRQSATFRAGEGCRLEPWED